jgi:hypothetical protein
MVFRKNIYPALFAFVVSLIVYNNQAYAQSSNFDYSLKLSSLSFSGTGIVPIKDDNNTKFYDAPHWTTNEEKPVCFVSGTKPKIDCLFQITGVCNSVLYVKGQASNGMLFGQQQLNIQSNSAIYPLTEANNGFDQGKADLLDGFTIDWYMTNNPSGAWIKVGTSKNTIYVVKNTPSAIYETITQQGNKIGLYKRQGDANYPTFHTILHIGCQYGKGEMADVTIVNNVYNYFKMKHVYSIENNFCMQYWGNTYGSGYNNNVPPELYSSLGLLKYGEGTCQGWATFFLEIMRTQGINNLELALLYWNKSELLSSTSITTLQQDLQANNLKRNPNQSNNRLQAYFYVKNWASSSSFVEVDKNNYSPGGYIASGDQNGLAGQCMDNPWSIFTDHVIIKYNSLYYDPSYGSNPVSNISDWQSSSVAYFGTSISAREIDDLQGPYQPYLWFKAINVNDVIVVEIVQY